MLNSTNDPVEQARITRELCESDCVNTILPPCAPMDQDIANFLNGAMQSNNDIPAQSLFMCHDYCNSSCVCMPAAHKCIHACLSFKL